MRIAVCALVGATAFVACVAFDAAMASGFAAIVAFGAAWAATERRGGRGA